MADSPGSATYTEEEHPKVDSSPEEDLRIKTRESDTPDKGNGMYVSTKVQPGTLLLYIPQPRLNIIKEGKIAKTCDNCFATNGEDEIKTVNIEGRKLVPCEGCNFIHYCSPGCKNDAFVNHHETECLIFKSIFDHHGFDKGSALLSKELTRAVIRLLSLVNDPDVPESAMDNFLGLKKPDMSTYPLAAELEKIAADTADLAEQCGLLNPVLSKVYGKEEVVDLCFVLSINNVAILHPDCNISLFAEYNDFYVHGGFCYDYPTQLNHACDPNCFIVHNKSELRVIASRYIPAGEELTFAYDAHDRCVENTSNYESLDFWNGVIHPLRRTDLRRRWGFDCLCSICPLGPLPPIAGCELLKKMNVPYDPYKYPLDPQSPFDEIRYLINIAHGARWPIFSYPMRETYHQSIQMHIEGGHWVIALAESCLLYWFDPHHVLPSIPLDEHLIALHWIVGIAKRVRGMMVIEGDDDGLEIYWGIYLGLELKLVRETARCFGADSELAKYERAEFEELLGIRGHEVDEDLVAYNFRMAGGRFMVRLGLDCRSLDQIFPDFLS